MLRTFAAIAAFSVAPALAAQCPALLTHKVANILGESQDLCEHAGKVVLVVNTASLCGYTPQYKGFDGLAKATGERPQWNFHKYLVARDGRKVDSFRTDVDPEAPQFVARVEALLGK